MPICWTAWFRCTRRRSSRAGSRIRLDLSGVIIEQFWDEAGGGFFYTGRAHEALIARGKDPHDNATPSGNAMAATALLRLAKLTGRVDLRDKAETTLRLYASLMKEHPTAMGQMLIALDFDLGPVEEYAVVGDPVGRGDAARLRASRSIRAGQGHSLAAGDGARWRRPVAIAGGQDGARADDVVCLSGLRVSGAVGGSGRGGGGANGEGVRMTQDPSGPSLYVIAGPNGAGKTTFARTFLPKYVECLPFVNADMIAQGLSPFAPEAAALQAGRLVLKQIRDLSCKRVDFALETTLSGKAYAPLFCRLKQEGYRIHLFFLWIPDVEMAVVRVAERVRRGGHNIPEKDIRRRHARGMHNLIHVYRPVLDSWILFENTSETPIIIARETGNEPEIQDAIRYAQFLEGGKNDE